MRISILLCSAFLVGFCGLGSLRAQERTAASERKDGVQHQEKASAIRGMYVKNDKGEDLGRIQDLAITCRGGNVLYAVLDYGGTLGFDRKHVAVPLSALKREEVKGRAHLLLDIAKDELDKMPGFNENDWPTMPDARFSKGKAASETARNRSHLRRASYLISMAADNPKAESLGTIRDLMIDCHEAKVVYAVLGRSPGTFRTEKYYAVPWQAIDVRSLTGRPADECFVIDVTPAALDSHAGFNREQWPTTGDAKLFPGK